MTDLNDLPAVFDDDRDEYDDAAELVDTALDDAPDDVTPGDARGLVAAAQLRTLGTIDERTHTLAVGATETAIRGERGHEPRGGR